MYGSRQERRDRGSPLQKTAEGWEAPSALALQPEPLSSHDKSCVCLEGAQLGLYPPEFALGRVYGPGATLIILKLGSFFLGY